MKRFVLYVESFNRKTMKDYILHLNQFIRDFNLVTFVSQLFLLLISKVTCETVQTDAKRSQRNQWDVFLDVSSHVFRARYNLQKYFMHCSEAVCKFHFVFASENFSNTISARLFWKWRECFLFSPISTSFFKALLYLFWKLTNYFYCASLEVNSWKLNMPSNTKFSVLSILRIKTWACLFQKIIENV